MMQGIEIFARAESKIRPFLMKLSPKQLAFFFSFSRKIFLNEFVKSTPTERIIIPNEYNKICWGLKFQSSVFNAAGMFKSGLGYRTCAYQGAGAFISGTTTALERHGNHKHGITHPFMPLSKTGAAINWMGLPNKGHETIAKRLSKIEKIEGCQIGASLSSDPDQLGLEALKGLVDGMSVYDKAGVDLIEINESCPNVLHEYGIVDCNGLDSSLVDRLNYVAEHFLKVRDRNLPVVVKLSNDTSIDLVEPLVKLLYDLGFDGINFGNTSTQYDRHRKSIDSEDLDKFDYFTSNFGGGLSGMPLKQVSLKLSTEAARIVKSMKSTHEFHIIRTGGIENNLDVKQSQEAGISLIQWFSGYFEQFGKHGHKLYRSLLNI